MNDDVRREFAMLAAHEPIPLARGALLIAKDEYPELDLEKYLDQLAALAREAEPVLRAAKGTVEKIQSLSEFLFTRKGFEGNRDQYGDPRNSFLNEVLERRLGIPISLSVLYIEVGRRLGLNLHGVSFPTHFLVKAVDNYRELIIDPFNHGAILDRDEIRARLQQIYQQPVDVRPEMLKPVSTRHILVRMLRNLKNIYAHGADWQRVLAVLDRILTLDPRSLEELLERAVLYERMECFAAALDDFQSFLTQAPEHPAAETVREAVIRLTQQVSRLN
jgi:regulator of sirC expression with transglutaminase-like and TPR domain